MALDNPHTNNIAAPDQSHNPFLSGYTTPAQAKNPFIYDLTESGGGGADAQLTALGFFLRQRSGNFSTLALEFNKRLRLSGDDPQAGGNVLPGITLTKLSGGASVPFSIVSWEIEGSVIYLTTAEFVNDDAQITATRAEGDWPKDYDGNTAANFSVTVEDAPALPTDNILTAYNAAMALTEPGEVPFTEGADTGINTLWDGNFGNGEVTTDLGKTLYPDWWIAQPALWKNLQDGSRISDVSDKPQGANAWIVTRNSSGRMAIRIKYARRNLLIGNPSYRYNSGTNEYLLLQDFENTNVAHDSGFPSDWPCEYGYDMASNRAIAYRHTDGLVGFASWQDGVLSLSYNISNQSIGLPSRTYATRIAYNPTNKRTLQGIEGKLYSYKISGDVISDLLTLDSHYETFPEYNPYQNSFVSIINTSSSISANSYKVQDSGITLDKTITSAYDFSGIKDITPFGYNFLLDEYYAFGLSVNSTNNSHRDVHIFTIKIDFSNKDIDVSNYVLGISHYLGLGDSISFSLAGAEIPNTVPMSYIDGLIRMYNNNSQSILLNNLVSIYEFKHEIAGMYKSGGTTFGGNIWGNPGYGFDNSKYQV
jgi:hypothetical protein